jgi:hypothetical protein
MSTINEEYKQKFTLSDNSNPFINPKPIKDPPVLYGNLQPTVFEPIRHTEITDNPSLISLISLIRKPSMVTYSGMKWNTKTSLTNPPRPFTVTGQNISFTKNFILPRRTTVLTSNVPKNALTFDCYTPVNDQVVVINTT